MTKQRSNGRVLWVDDDDERRFVFEESQLRRQGFQVTWAADVIKAAEHLSCEAFDVLIIDQMLAGHGVAADLVIWGGCRLLHWLRDPAAHPSFLTGTERAWGALDGLKPLGDNQRLPAAILSAYHNRDVLRATQLASDQDQAIPFLSKPVDIDQLIAFLRRTLPERE